MGKYTEAWNNLKPQRPKRPAGKFANFVADFSKEHKNPRHLLQNASEAWGNLDEDEKIQFFNQDAIDDYKKQLAEYKAKTAALKNPPGSYAIFVREYWRENQPNMKGSPAERRRRFSQVQQDISANWQDKTEEEKTVYREAAFLCKALMEREQDNVIRRKQALNLDWRDDGLEEVMQMVGTKKRKGNEKNEENGDEVHANEDDADE